MALPVALNLPGGWRSRVALALRFLVWPAAGWAVAGASGPAMAAGLPLPLAVAVLALAVISLALVLPSRLHPLAALAEAALAGVVVAMLGGPGSPWLLLFPWLVLDHGSRPGHRRLILPAVPLAYAAAVAWAGVMPSWEQLAVHGLVYAVVALQAVIPGAAPAGSKPAGREEEDSGESVIRLQERVLALFGSLAEQEAAGGTARADGSRGARALARALHALLSRQQAEESDVTFRHFDPAQLLETVCEDWAACARVRGLDLQGYAAFGDGVRAFGDLSRVTRVLDLLLLAGCFSATSGTMRLAGRLVDADAREPMVEFTLEVGGEPDGNFVAWRVRNALEARVEELGGGSRAGDSPLDTAWQARLPMELALLGTPDPGRLAGVAVHVTGDSMLREVMTDYASAEGALLVDEPGEARVILLAGSPRDPETEARCQDLKQAHPQVPVLCQGSTAITRASLMLETDGLIPVPFSRRDFVALVNRHLAPAGTGHRGRSEPDAAGPAESGDPGPGKEGSILVAEDDAISARVVVKFLEAEGCRVHRVQDGEAALAALRGGRPALALLDMHMPGLGGVEVASRFREWEREQGREPTPLVALTASAADADRRACREAGMDDFLNKPVDREALREILARYLGGEARNRHRDGVSGGDYREG